MVLVLGSIVLASAAAGSVWLTPSAESAGALVCRLSSAARVPARVRVEGLGRDGRITFDSGFFPLAAGAVFQSGTGPQTRRCRFTFRGAAELRGEALAFDPEQQVFRSYVATPVPRRSDADGTHERSRDRPR